MTYQSIAVTFTFMQMILSCLGISVTQSGINKVGDWAKEWLLKLNVEKCCGMSFAANISNVCTTKYYDTIRYFNVRSKANISRLNLPHGNDN